jgi:hypothetical protein
MMAKTMLMLSVGADTRLLEWLTSNPVAEVYSMDVPVMGISFETTRTTKRGEVVPDASGFRRWPLVPEPRY